MRDRHEAAGAVFGILRGVEVPRRYADPAREHEAATSGRAVRDRSHRVRLVVQGRRPGQMLTGILTGRLPDAPEEVAPENWSGRAEPQAVLTPKGRVVTDLRIWRAVAPDEEFVADVPAAGGPPLAEHLRRFLPPRFATAEDVSGKTGMLTVLGPEGPTALAEAGIEVSTAGLTAMDEGDLLARSGRWTIIRSGEVAAPAWDVIGEREAIRGLWDRLLAAGAAPVGSGVWEALRIEAGRPAYGDDMSVDTLLPETGLHTRVVDSTKGCYTGQEIVVRIRDRGHVNRHLRRLVLGDAPTPAAGTELFVDGGDRAIGTVTSAAASPRRGTLALAYVRRLIEPGGTVRVGAADGPEATVEALG